MHVEVRAVYHGRSSKSPGTVIVNTAVIIRPGDYILDLVGLRVSDGIVQMPGAVSRGRFFRLVNPNRAMLEAIVRAVEGLLQEHAPEHLPLKDMDAQEYANRPTLPNPELLASHSG